MRTVIQELGREGILPYSAFFASNKPFGAPFAGLLTQYIVSCLFVLGPPPGDAYLFMISSTSPSFFLSLEHGLTPAHCQHHPTRSR
jgi:amino acid transporter